MYLIKLERDTFENMKSQFDMKYDAITIVGIDNHITDYEIQQIKRICHETIIHNLDP